MSPRAAQPYGTGGAGVIEAERSDNGGDSLVKNRINPTETATAGAVLEYHPIAKARTPDRMD